MADVAALVLPGATTDYASAPDSAALSITGDIDLRIRVALTDWTPSAINELITKSVGTGNQRSYLFFLNAAGTVALSLSQSGTNFTTATSSAATGAADGSTLWVRVTWRNSDDRVQFFTATGTLTNPVAADFTQLGTDQTLAVTGIFDSTAPLGIGIANPANTPTLPLNGKIYRAQVRNGLDGTLVFDADFVNVVPTAVRTPSSFTESSSNAATVTMTGSAWSWFTLRSAIAIATLGGLSATAVGTPTVLGTAQASLGGLSATTTGKVTVPGTAQASLGSLSATAVGKTTVPATAVASLGGLTASAVAGVTVPATAQATLGGLTATAVGTPAVTGTAQANLGGLNATAAGLPTVAATANANLGALTASAVGLDTVPATAQSLLGSLQATAVGSAFGVESGVGSAPLGGLMATAAGLVSVRATGAALLGRLNATATGLRTFVGVGNANLGQLVAAATGKVTVLGVAVANLGPLQTGAITHATATSLRLRVSGREPAHQFAGTEPAHTVSGRRPVTSVSGRERGTP